MFPLDIVLNYAETMAWQMRYLRTGDTGARLATWMAVNEAVINPFMTYRVPTIALNRSTPKEAVCQVFEKVNTGGVELTVFELLTATYAADNFNLRDDWDARSATWADQPLLSDFRATDFLQIITLLSTRARRAAHLAAMPDDDRAPAVSAKRREMLRLPLADYQQWAGPVTAALPKLVRFLHAEHIFRARDLPYTTQLVPLAAIILALRVTLPVPGAGAPRLRPSRGAGDLALEGHRPVSSTAGHGRSGPPAIAGCGSGPISSVPPPQIPAASSSNWLTARQSATRNASGEIARLVGKDRWVAETRRTVGCSCQARTRLDMSTAGRRRLWQKPDISSATFRRR
jgi:hypothetical protein